QLSSRVTRFRSLLPKHGARSNSSQPSTTLPKPKRRSPCRSMPIIRAMRTGVRKALRNDRRALRRTASVRRSRGSQCESGHRLRDERDTPGEGRAGVKRGSVAKRSEVATVVDVRNVRDWLETEIRLIVGYIDMQDAQCAF